MPPAWVGAPGNAARRKAGPVRDEEARVSEFGDLEKKAEAYVKEHPEQADKEINEVAGIADPDPDHQHDEQIDRAAGAVEQQLGQGEDQQGNKD